MSSNEMMVFLARGILVSLFILEYQQDVSLGVKSQLIYDGCPVYVVDGLIREIVVDWISYLKTEHLFGNDDPLFPKTAMRQNDNKEFEAYGLLKECWSTANPIRTIFKSAFEDAGLEYFNPHSFRKTLVGLGERICQNPEEFKAWSQNLGHENVLTTYLSYGEVRPQRQSEIFKRLKEPKQPMKTNYDGSELAIAIAKEMGKKS